MSKKNKESLSTIKRKKFLKDNMPLLVVVGIILIIGAFVLINANLSNKSSNEQKIYGDDVVEMHYFYLSTCPHCHEQEKFHKTFLEQYPMVRIHEYEMTKPESMQKYIEMAKDYEGLDPNRFPGTPLTIIGDEFNIGFGSPETTGEKLNQMVENQLEKIKANWTDSMVTTKEIREQQGGSNEQ